MSEKKRDIWVDNVKLIACSLVVLGHLFQSMVRANILPNSDLYLWFNQTIYYFHVPLFFICSGFVYQKYSKVTNIFEWRNNVLKKIVALGVPYVTFSTVTWLMKNVFSNAVNDAGSEGIITVLVSSPLSPYWYLYALFFIFLITPTIKNKKDMYIWMVSAVVFKTISILQYVGNVYAISTILSNEIWFVFGMVCSVVDLDGITRKTYKHLPVIMVTVFVTVSITVFIWNKNGPMIKFILGLLGCLAVMLSVIKISKNNNQCSMMKFLVGYTMPIFLMHTIFAAGFRILLLKLGINNATMHVAGGICASVLGPIIATEIMRRYKWMDFFIYPGKYLKIKM